MWCCPDTRGHEFIIRISADFAFTCKAFAEDFDTLLCPSCPRQSLQWINIRVNYRKKKKNLMYLLYFINNIHGFCCFCIQASKFCIHSSNEECANWDTRKVFIASLVTKITGSSHYSNCFMFCPLFGMFTQYGLNSYSQEFISLILYHDKCFEVVYKCAKDKVLFCCDCRNIRFSNAVLLL